MHASDYKNTPWLIDKHGYLRPRANRSRKVISIQPLTSSMMEATMHTRTKTLSNRRLVAFTSPALVFAHFW
jgi:hypothetical protein